jgi:HAD superfamily phosphatase (TIGR01668 family)
MLTKLTPNEYYDSIFDIKPSYLKEIGITRIIVDLDNTLIPRNEIVAKDELIDWLKSMRNVGLKLVIVSNNTKTRVGIIARKLDLPLVAMAKKPSRLAFEKGMKAIQCKKEETAVIGDQIFTDVLGGNRMGLYSILVVPLSGHEHFVTKFVRQIEKLVLKRLEKRKLIPKDERRNGNNGAN